MVRDQVLSLLIQSSDYLSGETISRKIGVSRAAVNSSVMSLRNDGYTISSYTNRGYLLTERPDKISSGDIGAFLPDTRMKYVITLPVVDSTNTYCKDLARKGAPSGTVVISDCQTGGKGRRGRSFKSPEGVGIYLSYLLRPSTGLDRISEITCWTAVAITKAIKEAYDMDTQIKWVNDILIGGKKICGILTEASVEAESGMIDSCIIGIGINVNESEDFFKGELESIASSLSIANGGHKLMRAELAAALIRQLDHLAANWPSAHDNYLKSYREASITPGSKIKAYTTMMPDPSSPDKNSSDSKTGTALSIGDDFSLVVLFDGDKEPTSLKSGEVSVRGLYGYS